MKYTREQLDGQIYDSGIYQYLIEYLDGDNLQFICNGKKYTSCNYNTGYINNSLAINSNCKVIFNKPIEHSYEIY